MDILFEDNHIIAINKKPSEIIQGDKTGDVPLNEKVKEYIKKKYNKPGNVYLGTIHRIDRPVSGVILFGKTSKAISRLSEMFSTKEVKKTYWAVVKNKPEKEEDILVGFLFKNEKQNKSYQSPTPKKGYLESSLNYRIIASSDNYYLLEVNPQTGRHHQIRVQLSAMGCPIKGDLKYGFDRSNKNASIHLHARKINFVHPVTKENIEIIANPPSDPIWSYFVNLNL
jgi:23S rRNA pseudouridine1911/1915/1917 synthase